MRKLAGAVLFAFALLDGPSARGVESAAGFVINAENPASTMTRRSIARIFLRKTTFWPNGHTTDPIDQPTNSATRLAFSMDVLGMDTREVAGYLNQLLFSGKGVPPMTKPSDAEVMSYVHNSANAIGYVTGDAKVEEGVKVVILKD